MTITRYMPDQSQIRSEAGGRWAVHAHGDSGPYIISVHATEIDALRAAVAHYRPDASAVWLPWGTELTDALKTPETAARANLA